MPAVSRLKELLVRRADRERAPLFLGLSPVFGCVDGASDHPPGIQAYEPAVLEHARRGIGQPRPRPRRFLSGYGKGEDNEKGE